MSARWVITVQHAGALAARYLFCVALLAYALYEMHAKMPTTLVNPFVVLAAIALLLLPDVPAHLKQALEAVGPAVKDLWQSRAGR